MRLFTTTTVLMIGLALGFVATLVTVEQVQAQTCKEQIQCQVYKCNWSACIQAGGAQTMNCAKKGWYSQEDSAGSQCALKLLWGPPFFTCWIYWGECGGVKGTIDWSCQ